MNEQQFKEALSAKGIELTDTQMAQFAHISKSWSNGMRR
jgi:hypothetical protein